MFHLKKNVKNLCNVEGSIVVQSINEETWNFSGYYFPRKFKMKSRRLARHDDGGERPTYLVYVSDIFAQIGHLSEKCKKQRLLEAERNHLDMYVLTNCDKVRQYEKYILKQLYFSNKYILHQFINDIKNYFFTGFTWLKYAEHICNPLRMNLISSNRASLHTG